jgi:hypothetical protein
MPDLDDPHELRIVVHLVDDPVWALSHSVAIATSEFLAPFRTRLGGEFRDTIHQETADFLGW